MDDRPRVLLISSYPVAHTLYCAALEHEGFSPIPSRNTQDAAHIAAEENPALILLDLSLQEPPALELLYQLKAEPQTSLIPVLAIANTQEPTLNAQAMESGVDQLILRIDCTPARLASTAKEFFANNQMIEAVQNVKVVNPDEEMEPVDEAGEYSETTEQAVEIPAPIKFVLPEEPAAEEEAQPAEEIHKPAAKATPAAPSRPAVNPKTETRQMQRIPVPRKAAAAAAAAAMAGGGTPAGIPLSFSNASSLDSAVTALRMTFPAEVSTRLGPIRQSLQNALKNIEGEGKASLESLVQPVRDLLLHSVLVGHRKFAQLAEGVETLVEDLLDRPNQIKFSPLRTLAFAVEALGVVADADSYVDQTGHTMGRIALVVDDDALVSRIITQALERGGVNSLRVLDPKVALDLSKINRFDLFLLDINMPDINGIELCKQIRSSNGHEGAPVIFVTGVDAPEVRTFTTLVGGTDFVSKPFLASELCLKALTHLSKLA